MAADTKSQGSRLSFCRVTRHIVLFLIIITAAASVSCARGKIFHSILPDTIKLRTGDVVFRRGEGITSRVVLAADPQGNYSHIGIVVDSAGSPMIVHAVPGEADFEGDVDRVKMDKPEIFFSTDRASKGEVCRPADSTTARKAAETALRLYYKNVLFDDAFDDNDTTKMYCTELVAYAFRLAGINLTEGRRHTVDLPIISTECILPSDIHSSKYLRTIIMFHK